MMSKEGKIVDRREMLRVKLKSLAAEAKIIRREESRQRCQQLRDELAVHRRTVVRDAARHTHLAYGIIRGRSIEQMEQTQRRLPNWQEVRRMLRLYGPKGLDAEFKEPPRASAA